MPSFPADVALLRPVSPHSHAGDCRPVLGPQQKVDSKAPQPVTAQWHPSKSVNMKCLQEERTAARPSSPGIPPGDQQGHCGVFMVSALPTDPGKRFRL